MAKVKQTFRFLFSMQTSAGKHGTGHWPRIICKMPQIVIENRNIVLTVNVSINWSECPYSKVGNTGRKHRDMYAYMEVRVLLLSFKMHPLESYHA